MAQKTVLVVDDDPSILMVGRLALQRQGYAVVTAVGAAALPLAAERQPDVILLDIHMPGMDGLAVSRCLRADPATAYIPIILMSTRQNLRALSARLPVDDQLPKPFGLDELYAIVDRLLRIGVSGRLRWRAQLRVRSHQPPNRRLVHARRRCGTVVGGDPASGRHPWAVRDARAGQG